MQKTRVRQPFWKDSLPTRLLLPLPGCLWTPRWAWWSMQEAEAGAGKEVGTFELPGPHGKKYTIHHRKHRHSHQLFYVAEGVFQHLTQILDLLMGQVGATQVQVCQVSVVQKGPKEVHTISKVRSITIPIRDEALEPTEWSLNTKQDTPYPTLPTALLWLVALPWEILLLSPISFFLLGTSDSRQARRLHCLDVSCFLLVPPHPCVTTTHSRRGGQSTVSPQH